MQDEQGKRGTQGERKGAGASRRTLLTGLVAAAAGAPVLSALGTGTAYAGSADDTFASNTKLYEFFQNSPAQDGEGIDFARRYRRHDFLDADTAGIEPGKLTTILAIHGGGIEVGTSELCLGIAGYDPKDPARETRLFTADPAVYDYWMFEGLRKGSTVPNAPTNKELHVTSVNCDDPVARSLVAGSFNTVSVHGCTWQDANPKRTDGPKPGEDLKGVVLGGRNATLREAIGTNLKNAGFQIFSGGDQVNGDEPANICNRTLTGEGVQLELTRELRDWLYNDPSSAKNRQDTRNGHFLDFARACREAIAWYEGVQRTLHPGLRSQGPVAG